MTRFKLTNPSPIPNPNPGSITLQLNLPHHIITTTTTHAPTHAQPSLPVNQNPKSSAEDAILGLHDTAAFCQSFKLPFKLPFAFICIKSHQFMLTLESRRFPVLGEVSFCIRTLPNC